MFAYPKQAEFNRVLPKSKIYLHARPGRAMKQKFVSQVGEIIWKYKLAPETINLPARDGVAEIQVFEVALKEEDFDEALLDVIDRVIPYPILFRLTHGERIRFATSYKRPSEAEAGKWVIGGRFITPWQPCTISTAPLPVVLDLAGLYEILVRKHLPIPSRPGETLAEHMARHAAIQAKTREKENLQRRFQRERQFNRKVEINSQLHRIEGELAALHQMESSA